MDFIRAHADRRDGGGLRWGVEPICAVLTEHGVKIAPSTYYEHVDRPATAAEVREAVLCNQIRDVHAANYAVFGARKMWIVLNRMGVAVARCTVERLMREAGLAGAVRGKVKRTTISGHRADRYPDLVQRSFSPTRPNQLWVADMTYVSTWAGWAYVAFVTDAYARRIIGWAVGSTMTTDLVLAAFDHAVWTRHRDGHDPREVIHHTDAGAQYTAARFAEGLVGAGITGSIGTAGDSYDNALAETINGLYKTELIKPRKPWRTVEQVEYGTTEWVDWFNHQRPYEYCGDIPPAELEAAYYAARAPHHPVPVPV
ncbi:hypothetical protein GCM10009648_35910 [Tsukamurella spumae]